MKKLKLLIIALLVNYVLAGIFLYVFQRDFMYFPSEKISHNYKIMQYTVAAENIDIVVLNEAKEKAIIYFGGNGESVVGNAPEFKKMFSGHTIYLMNYRGYGGSTGKPTEKAFYADALFLYDNIIKRHKAISVIGRSLGSGVATYLAATRPVDRMVLITPYDSMKNIVDNMHPIFPTSLMLKDKFNSIDRIKDIRSKTLVILAENDTVIPFKNSKALIREFPSPQIIVETITNAGHNTLSTKDQYLKVLEQFMLPRK